MTTEELIDKLKRYVNSGILYSLLPEKVINEVIEKLKGGLNESDKEQGDKY